MVASEAEQIAGRLFVEERVRGECEGVGTGEGDRGPGGCGCLCAVPSGRAESAEREDAGVLGVVLGAQADDEEDERRRARVVLPEK